MDVHSARSSRGGLANIKTSLGKIGDALLPLVQLGQVIVSRFITPLTVHFQELGRFVDANWKG